MRDSMTASLSDGLAVAPLVHVLHLHAARSSASHSFFYHYAQIYEEDEADYHVSRPTFQYILCKNWQNKKYSN